MKLEHVTKRYRDTCALSDVCVEFEEGKICAVLGESGAGKTTLLSVLAGLIPFEGKAELVPVSYLFQEAKLLPHFTVEGNLRFVLPKEKWGEISPMLRRVGLSGKEGRYPKELSGGERQRAAIARAFLFPHEALLMDEPFSSLDLALKKSLIELVADLAEGGRETVVFVTHDVHEAALLSHRALVLSHGSLVLDLRIEGPLPRDFLKPQPAEERLVRALMREGEPLS